MPVDIREEVWVVVWEGMVIVIGEGDGEEVTFWARVTSGAEERLGIEVSINETYKEVSFSHDGEATKVFLGTWDDTELYEGTCNGILKTGGTVDERNDNPHK